MPNRITNYIAIALLLVGLLAAAIIGEKILLEKFVSETRSDTQNQLRFYHVQLEANLQSDTQLVKGLVAVIASNPDITQDEFSTAAKPLFETGSSLRNIAVAPDMVVRYVYPIIGNEGVIGLDYTKKEDQFDMVELARTSGKIALAGPVDLVQGGSGFISRIPVVTGTKDGNSRFWGMISAVIDVEKLYKKSGLMDAEISLEIAIRGKDGAGAKGAVFFGRADLFDANPVVANIPIPNGSWQMAAIPKDGWPVEPNNLWIIRAAFASIAMLIIFPFFALARATGRLSENELKLRGLYELSPLGIALTDMRGRYLEFNDAFQNICGYPKDELNSLDYWALTPEKYAEDEARQLESLEKTGQYGPYEKEYRRKDGSLIPIRLNGLLIKDNKGNDCIWSIVEDISERKASEATLRKLSQAIEQAGESVIITSRQGIIEYVNAAFTTITGYLPEDVLGKNPRVLKSGNQSEEFYERLWRTISSGNIWHSSVIDRKKDGSEYPAIMSIAPIFDESGEITHYVGIQQDMTAHQTLEDKFRQAQKMEALGTLVGGIAHDFNNMLAGITGNLYLAKRKVEGLPDAQEKLDNISKLSFRAAEMIQQLLVFARKGTIEMKLFGLTSFMKEAFKLSATTIPENIVLITELCREELIIKGDATQIQQVLMNLLNNARDALANTPSPEIHVKLESFRADKHFTSSHPKIHSEQFAHLTVSDNGCGISEHDQEHIFEPFFTSKEVGEGSGLGLPMAYGAVQSHGGFLEIESRVGIGTSVHIYLPLIKESRHTVTAEGEAVSVQGSGELILIVDDNTEILHTNKEVLESLGYQVLIASDGLEAVERFAANKETVQLIIMDIVMPKMGGVMAFECIKEMSPDAKVIFATGYDMDEALKSEMPSVEYEVLSKPYDIIQLSKLVRTKLDLQ